MQSFLSYIEAQAKNLKKRSMERRLSRPFVTISRQSGAYGMTMAENLAAYLQENERRKECSWTVFEKTLLDRVAEEHNLEDEILQYFPESAVSEIQDALEELFGLHPSQYNVVPKIGQTILHLAQLGYVIIVGRGANIITAKLTQGVHVRLIGSFDKRVAHMQEYLKLGEREAREYVIREDRNRAAYIRKYFDKDINDPSLYDVVINTDTISIVDAAHLIGDLILRPREA